MRHTVQLDRVQAGLVKLAHERYNAVMEVTSRRALADVEAALLPVRVAIGVPDLVHLSLDETPEGAYLASWEIEDVPVRESIGQPKPKLVGSKKK